MTADWVIITAPTDRGDAPARVLTRAIDKLRESRPEITVRIAILTGEERAITEALDDAVAGGARKVLLVSGQTLGDAPYDAWTKRLVGHWLRERARPDQSSSIPEITTPEIIIAPLLTTHDSYVTLLEEAIDDGGTPARTTTAPILSSLWEQVPTFTRHVLVCRGPRCSVEGASETASALQDALEERGLEDDDVLTTMTGCMFPCTLAPVVAVYPDGTWYSGIRPDRIGRLVDDHLVNGRPVTEWIARQVTPPPEVS